MPRDRLLTRPFVFVSLANLFQGMAFALFLHFPGYLQVLGADEVEIGVIVGVTAVAAVVVRPWLGRQMDVRGRRPVILAGNVVNIAALALYLTVTGLGPWVYVVRAFHGVAEASLFTSLFTFGADVVPSTRRTEGLALFGVSGLLPIALAGVVGDLILAVAEFRTLFLTAIGFAAAALAASLPLRDLPGAVALPVRRGFLAALTQRDLLPLWWVVGVFSIALTGYFTFLKTFVQETGVGSVGLFFSTYVAVALLLRLFLGWLPDRIGPKRVLFPALGALSIGFGILALSVTPLQIAAAGILCGIGHGFGFPIMYGFTVTRADPAYRGSAMAIFTALFDVGALIGGPLLGLVIRISGYPAMFTTAGVFLAVGAAAYGMWDRHAGIRADRAGSVFTPASGR